MKSAEKTRSSVDSTNGEEAPETARSGSLDTREPSSKVKAIDLLKAQHRELKRLFARFAETDDADESLQVALVICQKLTIHAAIEEELFYPLAREKDELREIVLESVEEHLSVKRIIADIEEVEVGDETLEAKVAVLEEQVLRHVKAEEDELFPLMKKLFSKEERRGLGQRLMGRALELEAAGDNEVGDGDDAYASGRSAQGEMREADSGSGPGAGPSDAARSAPAQH